jgi:hypothetical protein
MWFDYDETLVDRHRDWMNLHLQYLLENVAIKKKVFDCNFIYFPYQSFDFRPVIPPKCHENPNLANPLSWESMQSQVMSCLEFPVHWATYDLELAMESRDRDVADTDHIQQHEQIQRQLFQLHDFSKFY